ncbi:cysteine synthase A [Campylobacter fetus]|uniref:cysteine synthase A n=1 Tax=Campylobacter fetus TaxID=196 RepID=UPI00138E2723|nr:cysteine synthase A [Campylobacter fetus]
MKIANNVTELIGNTPLVRINKFGNDATILAKCEFLNPSHSVKDRIALNMIRVGMSEGKINKNSVIIEPTSGNTGVGLAMVCAQLGLKMILTMPSSMSLERQKLLKAFGAYLVLTDPKYGMQGAVNEAIKIANETENSFIPSQFDNPANPAMHKNTTAIEILNDTGGKVDILVAGFGTGGTISGIAEVLRAKNPNVKIIAVEPEKSPLLSKGEAGPHAIQGIGANFIPKNLNKDVVDEFFTVSNEDAIATAKALAQSEGLLVGISSGANIYAAKEVAKRAENHGKTIVTILCDTGERYLSTTLYD